MTIEEFIKLHNADFDQYKYEFVFNGYKVYNIWAKWQEGACVGYPQYALEKNGTIRESTLEETLAIMDEERKLRTE